MINIKTICKTLDTKSIQNAIDTVSEKKEVLYFPKGEYKVASLNLRDNTSLYLEEGALIQAAPEEEWKGVGRMPVLYCENVQNITICGKGTLSATGHEFVDEKGYKKEINDRPDNIIRFRNAKNILVEGVLFTNTVGWTVHFDNCDDVVVDGITIKNPPYSERKNSDGIDINGCRNVTIKNCFIETGDDAICLKNVDKGNPTSKRPDMYNINVHDCVLASTCNSTKIGTETVGDIYDVHFENIKIKKHSAIKKCGAGFPPYDSYHSLSAISVQSNDGAVVRDITFKNYLVETIDTPIFILFQHRERFVPPVETAKISNILIENVTVKHAYRNSQILSSDAGKIENVEIKGLKVSSFEEPKPECKYALPTGKEYPDVYNFGAFPAYGLFSRNAKDVNLGEDVVFYDKKNSGRKDVDIK